MTLHPQARALLAQLPALELDFASLRADAMRQAFDGMSTARAQDVPIAAVEERTVPGPAGEIPVRVYRPEGAGALPALAYFHGGGFVMGSLDTHDGTCRALANASGAAVVSVGYRLAPEHPFPAAPEDCYAATRWIAERGGEIGVDGARLAVGGDSAGGNLAAVVAHLARERGGPTLRHQLLVYPVTDCRFDTPSYEENAEGYLLTRAMMRWFWDQYLEAPGQADDPRAAPLRAKDLAGLPPAFVVTAGFDPLRDEGEAYAARLREAGVATEHRRWEGQFHGFLSMFDLLDDGRDAIAAAGARLRAALGG